MRNGAEKFGDDEGDDDQAAFSESVRGARPLSIGGAERVPLAPGDGRAPGIAAVVRRPATTAVARPLLTVDEAGDVWNARADGVSGSIVRRMRDGIVRVESHLDLHGMTRVQAAEALDRFVAAAREAGRRCLLVIHGRGLHSGPDGPALRDLVRDRLTSGPHAVAVLACASASPLHGGAGATILFLRR